jgi:hypothetical protein
MGNPLEKIKKGIEMNNPEWKKGIKDEGGGLKGTAGYLGNAAVGAGMMAKDAAKGVSSAAQAGARNVASAARTAFDTAKGAAIDFFDGRDDIPDVKFPEDKPKRKKP